MSTLEDWLADATSALELPPDSIPADLRNDLLGLTRDIAHGVTRIAGPLTCYLLGLAAARGGAPSASIALINALIPTLPEPAESAAENQPAPQQ
ncbi:hypothetical protein EH165_02785 [Nakamurella antarctica]|uniref:DUF6457 domain-containing protein n=1 Tax=Nakamurella antarctica TaxID=1902245 RepID=A0A3G8ZJ03_9ACTN|nr:DUF6457 domain-containing protein [Nakamurella antarctica]AZI57243.1 hypothetical protein EH165_02785 [Nakamurella antarctica]